MFNYKHFCFAQTICTIVCIEYINSIDCKITQFCSTDVSGIDDFDEPQTHCPSFHMFSIAIDHIFVSWFSSKSTSDPFLVLFHVQSNVRLYYQKVPSCPFPQF